MFCDRSTHSFSRAVPLQNFNWGYFFHFLLSWIPPAMHNAAPPKPQTILKILVKGPVDGFEELIAMIAPKIIR